MVKHFHTYNKRRLFLGTGLLLMLILLLTSCGGNTCSQPTPTTPATATATPTGSDITLCWVCLVVVGSQACPEAVKDPAHWDSIIGTQNGVTKVESVGCANIIDTPTLQALVTVRHSDTTKTLDVYIFDNITNSKPAELFKLSGLLNGDAQISYYNTLMTAEVDENSSLNQGKAIADQVQDLYREFEWSANAGTLVQTAFPGMYPDLTRYQAEADQVQVSQGKDPWKLDATVVAKNLAQQFLKWNKTVNATLVSGGGPQDVYATVQVVQNMAGSRDLSFNVTLSRLEGKAGNLWCVIKTESGSFLTLTSIEARVLGVFGFVFVGKGAAFEAVIGKAVVYDHLYNEVGSARILGSEGMGIVSYTTSISYTCTYSRGAQEGIVAAQSDNGGISSDIASAVMVKVILKP